MAAAAVAAASRRAPGTPRIVSTPMSNDTFYGCNEMISWSKTPEARTRVFSRLSLSFPFLTHERRKMERSFRETAGVKIRSPASEWGCDIAIAKFRGEISRDTR